MGPALQRPGRQRGHRRAADPDPGQPAEPARPADRAARSTRAARTWTRCRATCARPSCPSSSRATAETGHLKRCHLANPDAIYETEVLPEIAPDLVEMTITDEPHDRDQHGATGRSGTEILLPRTVDQDDDLDDTTGDVRRRRTRAAPTRGRADPGGRPTSKKYFPVKSSGLIRRTIGHVQAVDGVSFQVARGQRPGPGRRVRLRQVDDRPADHPALRPHRRVDDVRGRTTSATCRTGRCCRCAARSR